MGQEHQPLEQGLGRGEGLQIAVKSTSSSPFRSHLPASGLRLLTAATVIAQHTLLNPRCCSEHECGLQTTEVLSTHLLLLFLVHVLPWQSPCVHVGKAALDQGA